MASSKTNTHVCPRCAKLLGAHEYFELYESDGTMLAWGCIQCVIHAHTQQGVLPSKSATTATCAQCQQSWTTDSFFLLRCAAYSVPLANCCYRCMQTRLGNIAFAQNVQASFKTVGCAYCGQFIPDFAVVTLFALNTPMYLGCWACFASLMTQTPSNPNRGGTYCEDCGTMVARSTIGEHRYWYCDEDDYLDILCDACLGKRIQAKPMAKGQSKQAAAISAAIHALNAKTAANALPPAPPPPPPPSQNNIKVPTGWTPGGLYTAILSGTGPSGYGRMSLSDGENKPSPASDAAVRALLLQAARYVQVCNEGGDWDIIDPEIGISGKLLMELREYLGLPEGHDFTKREPKKK